MKKMLYLTIPVVMVLFLIFGYTNCGRYGFNAIGPVDSIRMWADYASKEKVVGQTPAARPLTVREYDAAIAVLLNDTSKPGSKQLPQDVFNPLDNYFENQTMSPAKIEALELTADGVTQAFINDDARLRAQLPCIPASVSDKACFTNIVNKLGALAFRRMLTPEETDKYTNFSLSFASKGANYKSGVEVLVKMLLQHPNFIYRWELGQAVDSVGSAYVLNDFELASKIAFTIWGQPPTYDLITAAAAGKFSQAAELESIVSKMLNDPKAIDQMDFFHSAWLGYSKYFDQNDIAKQMRTETKALIKRIIFDENRPWSDLLRHDETFVNTTLAQHYGMNAPANPSGSWVKYSDPLRKGIFSHGSFLSLGGKFGDTSTTQRGYFIRKNVFCEMIPPPPAGVNVDEPPRGDVVSPCKEINLNNSVLRVGTACYGCHQSMDPIGLGLENYSASGQFRAAQPDAPECVISGNGEAKGQGRFKGPAQLAEVALSSGRVEFCLVQRYLQYSNGLKSDVNLFNMTTAAVEDFKQDGNLKNFIKRLVLSPAFKIRKKLE